VKAQATRVLARSLQVVRNPEIEQQQNLQAERTREPYASFEVEYARGASELDGFGDYDDFDLDSSISYSLADEA
jgi:hypothetical protein